ncbi:ABC transporter ATP-binding protein [Rhodoferax sp.]|uniref:ABC transporter ATP-binding protein n=1 Tax=Rhodoferax sp. TaxID=50421 RepID=UPI00274B8623|nr:ABC transporter ATP-binding protein [Rhodoferax sp.]
MTVLAMDTSVAADTALLRVEHLSIGFKTDKGALRAVDDMSYQIRPGKTLGLVGESGCGKSTTALALMGLLPSNATVAGAAHFLNQELFAQTEAQWRRVRGDRIAMIFQEPMTALNPVLQIGEQIGETLLLHQGLAPKVARERAIDMLDEVGIPSARTRASAYPHQLSGGMRQRAMIAMALACRPSLLIADEPTTALDVTIQAQILELMLELQDRIGMAIQFISHNLGVVSELADDIIVMYAGRIVERAPAAELFAQPRHPYTVGLIHTLPNLSNRQPRLPVIAGGMPDLTVPVPGCRFADRCGRVVRQCREQVPPLAAVAPDHDVACFRADA